MNKFLNPFEYLSTARAFWWGLLGTVIAIVLLALVDTPLDSALDVVTLLSSNLLLWLPLSLMLYVIALFISPSRIRAVDIFATNLFALLPSILGLGLLSTASCQLNKVVCEPCSVGDVMISAATYLTIILLSIMLVWSIVWGCFAYCISANLKGLRGIVTFTLSYIFVSVAIQLVIKYMYICCTCA